MEGIRWQPFSAKTPLSCGGVVASTHPQRDGRPSFADLKIINNKLVKNRVQALDMATSKWK